MSVTILAIDLRKFNFLICWHELAGRRKKGLAPAALHPRREADERTLPVQHAWASQVRWEAKPPSGRSSRPVPAVGFAQVTRT